MRKQTKLVAVLSAAALLALGASMTSFAATGWVEEDGTWVFYDKDGYRVTDTWKKSVNNWFYLDDDGEMATDALIEDNDNYYYVDENGAMVTNTWKSVPNDDAGEDDEPENHWYYFQGNGKAYKATGNTSNASFKTINGKKYVFNDEGKMQYGWVNEEGERQTGDDDWQNADYYCGDENDGAQTIGWKEIHLVDNDWDPDSEVNGDSFDEDQDRWFYFKSTGKRYTSKDGDKTINGRKYRFDDNGRMIAEWYTKATTSTKSSGSRTATGSMTFDGDEIGTVRTGTNSQGNKAYTNTWKYYGTPEDGARVTKGWFQVVPSEYLHESAYNDDADAWYYSDGDGYLVANEFKTINGKKYAFDSFGRMLKDLRIIQVESTDKNKIVEIYNTDTYDTEEKFNSLYNILCADLAWDEDGKVYGVGLKNVYAFYFGSDGSMKTGKQTITLDGDDLSFNFEKSGSKKGRGVNGIDSDKVYLGGKLYKADADEKYELVVFFGDKSVLKLSITDITSVLRGITTEDGKKTYYFAGKGDDFKNSLTRLFGETVTDYKLVTTSGSVVKSKSRCKTGDDAILDVKNEKILSIFEEN